MNKLVSLFKNAKSFKWSLWISLCASALVPAIYQTIRTAIVSTQVSASGIDIIGQMEWFDLIDETIKAFLIIPLYSLFNKAIKENNESLPKVVFKTLLIVVSLYSVFSLIVLFYGAYLISFMNQQEMDISAITTYLHLETIAFMVGIIPSFFNVVFVTTEKKKNVYLFLAVQTILSIIFDFLLIPRMGVNGIAINNIITYCVLSVIGFFLLWKEGLIRPSWFEKEDKKRGLSWLCTGSFSGTQQFIDNIIYALMVVRMVNMVSEQGNYWVANNFIWGWLLVPIMALSEIVKTDCKEKDTNVRRSNYYLLTILIICIWIISIPLWPLFLRYVERLDNYQDIFLILLKLMPFYVAYALCIVPDSIFIGNGKTYFNAINSVLVNFLYYGIWFAFFLAGYISFDMNMIIIMFGFGMVFHLLISLVEQLLFDKRKHMDVQRD